MSRMSVHAARDMMSIDTPHWSIRSTYLSSNQLVDTARCCRCNRLERDVGRSSNKANTRGSMCHNDDSCPRHKREALIQQRNGAITPRMKG